MKEIEQYISTYFGIQEKLLPVIGELFKQQELSKNEFFLRKGKYSTPLSFVKSGFLRVSAPAPDASKEITQWIATPGTFITDLGTLSFGASSRWNIQALVDCELYTISDEKYREISQHVPNWQELEKLFIAKCFITLENRVFQQLSMNAEEKFQQLFDESPELFNQVPLQYIASMLGMTPETLSRIRKKKIS